MRNEINKSIYFNFLIFFILFSLKEISSLDESKELCNQGDCNSILISGSIIFINSADTNIYIYDESTSRNIGNYNEMLVVNKNILKIDETHFIIYGFKKDGGQDEDGIFYYQIFSIKDNQIRPEGEIASCNIGLKKSPKKQTYFIFNIKVIPNTEKLIISTIFDNTFWIIRLNLNNNEDVLKSSISDEEEILSEIEGMKSNIQCNSLDEINYFCIFHYINGETFYINGNFKSNNANKDDVIIGNICNSDCYNGNIEVVREDNKYLICYQNIKSGNPFIISINCQYYIYFSDQFNIDQEFEISTFSYIKGSNPLILYKFDNSIFIQFCYTTDDSEFSYVIVSSLDFKLKADFKILNFFGKKSLSTINFYNDENKIYNIYKRDGIIYIYSQELIKCHNEKSIILSVNNNKKKVNFLEDHESLEIKFLLNENIKLNPPRTYYNPSDINKDFYFVRNDKSGVFENFYIYYSSGNRFSLICKISATSCYSLCDNCIDGKVGNSTNNFCDKCIVNYYPKEDDNNKAKGFNCYEKNQLMENYYLDSNGKFSKCDISCKYCINSTSCKSCSDSYYFKYDNNKIKNDSLCIKESEGYYLSYLSGNELIYNSYKEYSEIINAVYKKCFISCKTCFGPGTFQNNNCKECSNSTNYKKYKFSDRQCLIDHYEICYKQRKYWEFYNNNITCTSTCTGSIILYGENKGQCVPDCDNTQNPDFIGSTYYNYKYCKGKDCKNFCLHIENCTKYQFDVINEQKSCVRKKGFENITINEFNENDDPFIDDFKTSIVTTIEITEPLQPMTTILPTEIPRKPETSEEKEQDILNRVIVYKIFKEERNYSKIDEFNFTIIEEEYFELLGKESENYKSENIYLITSRTYKNFIITIYPLDIEQIFVFDKIIIPNNLGYINFTNFFNNLIDYERFNFKIILVVLIERISSHSAINELNYYFCEIDEDVKNNKDFNGHINIKELNVTSFDDDQYLKVIYNLKNYYNENSSLTKRNTEYLVENIKSFYSKKPNIQLYNISDPFYNDICLEFISEFDTDMTLDDRRKTYYVNKSLCENNCYLDKLIINDNVRSVCSCQFKNNFTENKNEGIKDDIPSISKINANSIKCIERTFNSNNISKNIVFWIILIFIIFLIIMLLAYIIYGNLTLKRIFHLETSEKEEEKNSNISENIKIKENKTSNNVERKKKSNENIDNNLLDVKDSDMKNSILSSKNKLINKLIINNNKNENNNNKKSNMSKNPSLNDYNEENKEQSKNINPMDLISDKSKSNPPKKKEVQKAESITTKVGNEEKDIISSELNFSNRYKIQSSEISYESYKDEKPILIDNLLDTSIQLKNNYINYPREYAKKIIINNIRNSLLISEGDEDNNEEYITDFYEEDNEPEITNNKRKLKGGRKKNRKIIKLLDGEDLFNDKNFNEEYNSENNRKNKFNKNKNGSKNTDNYSEDEFDVHFTENILNNKKYKGKKNSKRTILSKIKDKGENSISTNNIIKDDTSNSNKRDPILTMSNIVKNEDKNIERKKSRKQPIKRGEIHESSGENDEDEYGKDEDVKKKKLITDYEKDVTNKIKNTLNNVDPNEIKEDSDASSIKKMINKSVNSSREDKLKHRKKDLKHGKRNNKHIFNFQEEEEKNGDMALPEGYTKKSKKRSIRNQKNNIVEITDNQNKDKDKNIEKKSDFEIFNEKVLGSSCSIYMEEDLDKKIKKDINIFKFYWRYFKKRELILVSFIDPQDEIPYFVRWSCFVFCLFFIFMMNCFFFFESTVHDRFINAVNGGENDIKYYFKHEFVFCIFSTLIYIVFKMIIIKLVLNRALKVKKEAKRIMEHSYEKGLTEEEINGLKDKRVNVLIKYHIRLIIYFAVMIILSIFFAYICICYSEIFKKSIDSILYGFVFSIILSFIFCAIICLIIISVYKVGKKCKNKCLLSTYYILSTIY